MEKEPGKIPWQLLLQADPSPERIQEYLSDGKILIAENDEREVIGVCVLSFDKTTAEIKNISVKASHQGAGIGQRLLGAAKEVCRTNAQKSLTVCTGNSSIGQMAFYQKCGFEMVGFVPNYFVKNYPEPIFENGIQCKHQIIFRYEFNDF